MSPLLVVWLVSSIFQPNNDFVLGKWTNSFDNAIIEFIEIDNTYSARLIKPAEGYEVDKKGNSRIGETILKQLKYQNGSYIEGHFYLSKFNKYMDCTLIPVDKDFDLKISFGLMKRTIRWTRIK